MPPLTNTDQVSLAVETSGRIGSVALACGNRILEYAELSGFRRHSSELLVTINGMLSRHSLVPIDIKRIYLPKGPGSFTGIRIAVTFAKMAAFALNTEIFAVDTLEALAENAICAIENQTVPIQRLAAILDAKRNLFYIAVFDWVKDHFERKTDDLLISAGDFLSSYCTQCPPVYLLGEGLLYYEQLFEHPNTVILDKSFWPAKAESVWRLGQKQAVSGKFEDPYTLLPLYIRRPEAEEIWEKRKSSQF